MNEKNIISVANKVGSIYALINYSNKTKWKDRMKVIKDLKRALIKERRKGKTKC